MDVPISAKTALLQALIAGDGYGLDLIERVKDRTGGQIVLGQGSVYPALRELERDGLATSYESEPLPERGGRPRRYYRITGEGRKVAALQRKALLGILKPVVT
jgi:PadR family transcriptional regulator, regulatory protein PadR